MKKDKIFKIIFSILILSGFFYLAFDKNNSELSFGDIVGDIDGNGKTNSLDYIFIKNHILGKSTLTDDKLKRADVNNDGKINTLDYITIKGIIIEASSVPVDNIWLNKKETTILTTRKEQLEVTIEPSNATNQKIIWNSSDESIITVDSNGLVTAKKVGTANITATSSNNIKVVCKVVVKDLGEDVCNSLASNNNRTYLDYKDFVQEYSKSSSYYDDFYPIKATHECANKHNLPVKATKDTYHIYKKNADKIDVKTDTDLNNSIIYIHDENVVNINGNNGKAFVNENIYSIANDKCTEEKGNIKLTNLGYNNTVEELKKYSYSYVTIENSNKKVFKRSGNDKNDGSNAIDSFRVRNGLVLDPLFWKYDTITKMTVCPISSKQLKFENAIFYSIVDTNDYSNKTTLKATGSSYVRRGISISRNNTKINNITHGYVTYNKSSNTHKTKDTITYQYLGFFHFNNTSDIVFSNSKVQALKINNKYSHSSYDIRMDSVTNIEVNSVTMNDYAKNNKSYFNQSTNQLKKDLWGVVGTNNIKNINYKNCVLNRIDTHKGVYNINIEDTIVGRNGITQIGFGTMNIKNVDFYYTNKPIQLRTDYGSLWNGTINISNSTIHPNNNKKISLISFDIEFDDKNNVHDYGYDLYLPKVNINNLKVNNSSDTIYIFDNGKIFNNKLFDSDFIKKNVGKLNLLKDYIPKDSNGNSKYTFTYATKKDINVKNVKNKSKAIKVQNYTYNFGEN